MYDLPFYNFFHIFRAQFDLARLDQSLHVKVAIMYYFKNLQIVFGDVPQGREYFSSKGELFLLPGKISRAE